MPRAGEAGTWHQLASIDLDEGAYPAARDKFQRALAIEQQIGDRAGEAATWHQLASIDLNERAYPAARDKFQRALVINQQIGNRAGEAAAWFQLGSWANATGDLRKALRLIGLCFQIDREMGRGNAESDYGAIAKLAGQLDLTPEQLAAELKSVARTYAQDRGASLLQ
jgi:tetratricopeptide (TPR) repeat protein